MQQITLNDTLFDRTLTFKGETIGSGLIGSVYRNLDSGGYVLQDHRGFCEEYPGNTVWEALEQYHPKKACPDLGGPTEEEQLNELTRTYLLLSSASEKDPFIKAILEGTVYRKIVYNYIKRVEAELEAKQS